MTDRETPTPRITSMSAVWRDASRELSDKLYQLQLGLSKDLRKSLDRNAITLVTSMRQSADAFYRIFDAWPNGDVPIELKQEQRAAFEAFNTSASAVLKAYGVKR